MNVDSQQCECIVLKNFKRVTSSPAECCLWGTQWLLMSCSLCHHSEKTARISIGSYVVLFKVLSGFMTYHIMCKQVPLQGFRADLVYLDAFLWNSCLSWLIQQQHTVRCKAIIGSLDLPGLTWQAQTTAFPFQTCLETYKFLQNWSQGEPENIVSVGEGDSKHHVW